MSSQEKFNKLVCALYKLTERVANIELELHAAREELAEFFNWLGPVEAMEPEEEQIYDKLPWEQSRGERLGEYERVCKATCQNSDLFRHLFQILEVNGAIISKPFKIGNRHFWTYQDCIYRREAK